MAPCAGVKYLVRKPVEWIEPGKLEVRAYPSEHLHANPLILGGEGIRWVLGEIPPGFPFSREER